MSNNIEQFYPVIEYIMAQSNRQANFEAAALLLVQQLRAKRIEDRETLNFYLRDLLDQYNSALAAERIATRH